MQRKAPPKLIIELRLKRPWRSDLAADCDAYRFHQPSRLNWLRDKRRKEVSLRLREPRDHGRQQDQRQIAGSGKAPNFLSHAHAVCPGNALTEDGEVESGAREQ